MNLFIDPAERRQLAAAILGGFCANPAIFAPNARCGWSLVNACDCDIAGYAMKLADEIIEAESATRKAEEKKQLDAREAAGNVF